MSNPYERMRKAVALALDNFYQETGVAVGSMSVSYMTLATKSEGRTEIEDAVMGDLTFTFFDRTSKRPTVVGVKE